MFDLGLYVICLRAIGLAITNIERTGIRNVNPWDIMTISASIAYIVRTILVYMGVIK